MLAAFKLHVLPPTVYLLVLVFSILALVRRGDMALFLFCVLAAFPQFWYPAQSFPGGSLLLTILIASAFAGAFFRSLSARDPVPWQALVWMMILFSYAGLWMSASNFGLPIPISSAHPDIAAWKNHAMMLLLYVVTYRTLRNEADLRNLVLLFVILLLLTSWREVSGFVSGNSFSYSRRANGAFWIVGLNANHFGTFVAELGALCLAIAVHPNGKWIRRLGIAAFMLSLYPLFYSYSRGAYLGLVAAIFIIGLLRYRLLLVGLAALVVSWQVVLPDSVVDRLQTTESADGTLEESASLRLQMWELAKQVASDHPVAGIGYNGIYHASAGMPLRNAHNFYLETLADLGVIGLLLLLLAITRAAYVGLKLSRAGHSPFASSVGLGLLAMTAVVAVCNLFGDRFSQLELGCYFWILFGAAQRYLSLETIKAAETRSSPATGV